MSTIETVSISLGAFVAGLTIVGFFMKNIKTNIANAVKRAEIDKGNQADLEKLEENQKRFDERLEKFEELHNKLIDRLLNDSKPQPLK